MKQVTPSLLLTLMVCVLIGYFEPANAQSSSAANANMVAYNPNGNSPFWPNPIGPGATITVTSADVPTGGYLVSSIDGSQTPISIISTGAPMPKGVATNQWFPVDGVNNLYGTNANIAASSLSSSLASATSSDSTGSDSSASSISSPSSTTSAALATGNPLSGGPAGVAYFPWFPLDLYNNPITATVGNVATNQWFPVDAAGNPIGAGSLGVATNQWFPVDAANNNGSGQAGVATNQWFPVDATNNSGSGQASVATNQWFPVDAFPGLANLDPAATVAPTATTVSLSSVPDGNYVLVITGQSGNTYTSNIVISSN